MHARPWHRIAVASIATLVLAACGSDAEEPAAGSPAPADEATTSEPVSNACPVEGCEITIVDTAADGGEIAVTWETNFAPDVSKNHIHIYWDIYTADEVTSDAEARGEQQGEWVPTDVVPTYVTESAVAVSERGDSTMICATAADRDHVVLDSSIVDCVDVSELL
jgi:hypothetical protein